MIHILDLHFYYPDVIATYLIESNDGLILVDPGPYSTFSHLENEINSAGFRLDEVGHVLLTHIHFDHAGATWALCELGATAYVHPVGYPHMASPEKLYNSARQIYGDQMEELWGEMRPIREERLVSVEHGTEWHLGGLTFTAHHTPGHAKHHIAWQLGEDIFTGDVSGVKIGNCPFVQPPCPPPDIDLEAWEDSIDLLLKLSPKRIFPTHFGPVNDPERHLAELRDRLGSWAKFVRADLIAGKSAEAMRPEFLAMARKELQAAGCDEGTIDKYEKANPSFMSIAGLRRYWKKKAERLGKPMEEIE